MQKLPMHTKNQADENFRKLADLFPQAVTEVIAGYDENNKPIIERAIDKDILMSEIAAHVVEGREQRYQFTWPDKAKTVQAAHQPLYKTLRPCREESVNFDSTENLYIEGDNLEVLKLLQETYLGRVKMIYIDPPYNTGNDFVYNDKFVVDSDEWSEMSGDYDDEGNRLFKNTDSNGRFHTDWLNMMYPRLKVARDLLSDDGVIFISIDDNEVHNLRKMCDEVFGAGNFVACVAWQRRTSPDARRIISAGHEYIAIYAKNLKENVPIKQMPLSDKDKQAYKNPDNDPRGPWISTDCTAQAGHGTKNQFYIFTTPNGRTIELPDSLCWRYTKDKFDEEIKAGRIWFGKDGDGVPRKKTYLAEKKGRNLWTWWPNTEVGHTQSAAQKLTQILGGKIFDFSKPTDLLQRCLKISTQNNDIILDFFSGSATTAHAVMQLNAEDGGNRKFIMVQWPEVTDEKSEARKAGYANICEIGKERIRRAGKKVVSDQWAVISDEEKARYGCKELSRADCVAKGHGACQASLFDCKKTTQRGDVCTVGSDETLSSVDSVEHSGRTGTQFKQGVYPISVHSKGVTGGIGNTDACVRESRLPCPYGHFGSDALASRGGEDALCAYKLTPRCPLTTNHSPLTTDIGFRVLKTDSTNMEHVYYTPKEYTQNMLVNLEDNIKKDRTAEDLLFQVMLELAVPLSGRIEMHDIDGAHVFSVEGAGQAEYLMACFDSKIHESIVEHVAQKRPYYFVMRDSSIGSDSVSTNFEQIFATYSPDTQIKVL